MTVSAANNPFRMQRVEAIRYQLDGLTWDDLLHRIAASPNAGRGAIVGPHGSGKTTFLRDLAIRLRERGEPVIELFTNRDGRGALPDTWRQACADLRLHHPGSLQPLVLADGYDALNPLARHWLRRHTPRLIVTAQRPCLLPTLLRTRARPEVLAQLVHELTGQALPIATLACLLHDHRGNMRDAIRTLYDHASLKACLKY